jgi:Protein of unknown function (DUF2975)
MKLFQLPNLLRISRPLVLFFMIGAATSAFVLIMKTARSTSDTEVRIALNLVSPNLFTFAHDVRAGFEDGRAGKHYPERSPLSPFNSGPAAFKLDADPQQPLLRYQEPSYGKRILLLYAGASDEYMSLAWVIFFVAGSWLLWLMLLDVTPTTPFTFANAKRLRNLGLLILFLDFGQEITYLALRFIVPNFQMQGVEEPLSHYVRLNTESTLPGWEIGLALLIVAAIYKRGVHLLEEAELTV